MEKTDLTLSPWLVIPYGEDQKSQAFYNICKPNNTSCRKSIPELKGKSFYQKNCHQGWLIVLCHDKEFDYTPWNYGDCFLFNPSSMETINLPCLPDYFSSDRNSLSDCVLTSPPKTRTYDDDGRRSMVFMLFSTTYDDILKCILKFCHPGDEEWKTYMIDDKYDVGEVLSMCYFKDKLYIMCKGSNNLEVDPETLSTRIIHIRYATVRGVLGDQSITYYVESADGIFMIEKVFISRGDTYEFCVTNMVISKLDFSSMSWVEVTSLDDHVILLDRTTRLSCSAKELGFTQGCVYFTQLNEMSFYKYDLEDNSIMLSLPYPDLQIPWFSANLLMIPTTLIGYVKELYVHEKKGVTEHLLADTGDESQVLKSIVSREEAKPWVLEDDMVWSISNYLNPVDNIHFRAVCKTYRSIIPLLHRRRSCPVKCSNLSPWLVFPKNSEAVYSFINPMHNDENYLMSIPELLKGSTILCSKGGWLLMSKALTGMFFHNPFTKATIKLPDLTDNIGGFLYRGIAFSSLPTSSDCVVFAIKDYLFDEVKISFIKRGDDNKLWVSRVHRSETEIKEDNV